MCKSSCLSVDEVEVNVVIERVLERKAWQALGFNTILALKYTPVAVALLKEVPSQVKKHTHGSYIASIMRIP
jgi:hypothetical protein